MSRTIVIGDIHGGLRALEQVIIRSGILKEDRLIFLGDYVDGWSESAQVVDHLIDLSNINECIFIKGNHDAWCEDWLNGLPANEDWLRHGGKSTITSYANFSENEKAVHRDFFNPLKNFYVDDTNRLFIHAGFTSVHGPDKESDKRNCYWDRTLWEMALAMDKQLPKDPKLYPKQLKHYNEIYIGHTPTLYYDSMRPMHALNVWNIDTGAAFTGKLSAMNIDTKEMWQSDSVQELYPNEKGRN